MAFKEVTCKQCGNVFKMYNSLQKCQSDECRTLRSRVFQPKKFNNNLKLKTLYTIQKVSKTNKKIPKEKSLSDYKADLQAEINAIIREIDKGHPCICNPLKRMRTITAGHLFSVGSNETLRFHLLNIWGQDFNSNGAKGGEPTEFKNGLITLYGNEFFESLESLKSIKSINLKIDDLKEKISIARGILKWIKLQDRKFSNSERLELRIEFNEKLGIY